MGGICYVNAVILLIASRHADPLFGCLRGACCAVDAVGLCLDSKPAPQGAKAEGPAVKPG